MAKNNKKPKREFSLIHYNYNFGLYEYVQIMSMQQAVMLDYLVKGRNLLEERYNDEHLRERFADDGEFYKADDWFMCSSETVRRDLNITLAQEQRLLNYLRKNKFIKTRRFGMPGTRYVKIMNAKLERLTKNNLTRYSWT